MASAETIASWAAIAVALLASVVALWRQRSVGAELRAQSQATLMLQVRTGAVERETKRHAVEFARVRGDIGWDDSRALTQQIDGETLGEYVRKTRG